MPLPPGTPPTSRQPSRLVLLTALLVACFPAVAAADDMEDCKNFEKSPDAAIAACSRVVESDQVKGQDLAVVYRTPGNGQHRNGNFDRAIADFDEAIRLAPMDAVAFNRRGLVWRLKGDLDRAIADQNEAIRIDQKYALAFTSRAITWERKGDLNR